MLDDIRLERVWNDISEEVSCSQVNFLKKKFYIMKDIDTCFVMAELDFMTDDKVENEININIRSLEGDFMPCENTTFAIKNDEINSFIKIKLIPSVLKLESFPFSKNAKYEFNIQFFFMLKSQSRNEFINSFRL